ncbi:hypothetical protein [Arcanobacterium buesumense]|uniref:Uncharacterized protein n=1 Tax=Arcanobacterium buesumense TaxID=2722751 RepID=A0A6H2ELQ1_9ACTO|nr:hypothetical protein [Arcanobacterium buesumense]QJC21999.1 hypothetical protein HC352_05445 [Arcanobacterium buesumense]
MELRKAFFGSREITKAYFGSKLIFGKTVHVEGSADGTYWDSATVIYVNFLKIGERPLWLEVTSIKIYSQEYNCTAEPGDWNSIKLTLDRKLGQKVATGTKIIGYK